MAEEELVVCKQCGARLADGSSYCLVTPRNSSTTSSYCFPCFDEGMTEGWDRSQPKESPPPSPPQPKLLKPLRRTGSRGSVRMRAKKRSPVKPELRRSKSAGNLSRLAPPMGRGKPIIPKLAMTSDPGTKTGAFGGIPVSSIPEDGKLLRFGGVPVRVQTARVSGKFEEITII